MEPLKSWIKPVLAVLAIGLLLIGLIAWLLLSKAKQISVSHEHLYSEEGAIMASPDSPVVASPVKALVASSQTSEVSPQGVAVQAAPPPPQESVAGAPPPPPPSQAGVVPQPQGAPSAQAAPDSQTRNQQMRRSMKERLEKTTPEDRARMEQLRIEERKYRQSHGGGGNGGGPRRGGG
jgi:hypothetical protein